jgi:small-conductance mechanosensitive channel
MRGWFAMRNLFDRLRRALLNVKVALKGVMVLIYTQFLRHCDWKSSKQYETLGTIRVAIDNEPAELKGRLERIYSRWKEQLQEEKKKATSHIERFEIKERLRRIKKAKDYLMMSDKERFWEEQSEWRQEAFRMMREDLAKMRW